MTVNRMRLFSAAVALQCLCASPGMAARKAFAEYWVPQSDGETIRSYYIGKRKIGPDRFVVAYSNLDVDKRTRSSWKSRATVDCKRNTVTEDGGLITINPADKDVSMATITAQNLWWLVCRGAFRKYAPPGL